MSAVIRDVSPAFRGIQLSGVVFLLLWEPGDLPESTQVPMAPRSAVLA